LYEQQINVLKNILNEKDKIIKQYNDKLKKKNNINKNNINNFNDINQLKLLNK